MTIKELYEWACENEIENFDISALQPDGSYGTNIEPYIRPDLMEVAL